MNMTSKSKKIVIAIDQIFLLLGRAFSQRSRRWRICNAMRVERERFQGSDLAGRGGAGGRYRTNGSWSTTPPRTAVLMPDQRRMVCLVLAKNDDAGRPCDACRDGC